MELGTEIHTVEGSDPSNKQDVAEKKLVSAIIQFAINDLTSNSMEYRFHAYHYFKSNMLDKHCYLLGIPPCRVRAKYSEELVKVRDEIRSIK